MMAIEAALPDPIARRNERSMRCLEGRRPASAGRSSG